MNPLRAGIVRNLEALDSYPYAGRSAIMGRCKREWQSVDSALSLFDTRLMRARRAYRKYVAAGVDQGKRWDLIGGGLIRSAGGWSGVRSLVKDGIFFKSDERMLGDSDFVENVLAEADEAMERKYALAAQGIDLHRLIHLASDLVSIRPERIAGPGKSRDLVKARNLICHLGASELGLTMTHLGATLGISVPTVSVAAKRGERIAFENKYSLIELLNVNI